MALDTFNPYLFVSAGEQSNKFLTPTYADGIAKFQAQRAQELTGLTVQFGPIQEGTGDPAPDNVRPISGRTGLMTVISGGKNLLNGDNVTLTRDGTRDHFWHFGATIPAGTYTFSCDVSDATNARNVVVNFRKTGSGTNYGTINIPSGASGRFSSPVTITDSVERIYVYISTLESSDATITLTNPQVEYGTSASDYTPYVALNTYPITWQAEAGTVYGGTLDVVSGVLTVDWDYIASYDGETLPGEWISDRDVYAEGTTPTTGAEVAYKIADPVTYQLDPEQIMTLAGYNQIYSDAGPVIDIQF